MQVALVGDVEEDVGGVGPVAEIPDSLIYVVVHAWPLLSAALTAVCLCGQALHHIYAPHTVRVAHQALLDVSRTMGRQQSHTMAA